MSGPVVTGVVVLPEGVKRADLLAELDREIGMRDAVYPRLVREGKLSQAESNARTGRLLIVRSVIAQLPPDGAPPPQGDLFARKP